MFSADMSGGDINNDMITRGDFGATCRTSNDHYFLSFDNASYASLIVNKYKQIRADIEKTPDCLQQSSRFRLERNPI